MRFDIVSVFLHHLWHLNQVAIPFSNHCWNDSAVFCIQSLHFHLKLSVVSLHHYDILKNSARKDRKKSNTIYSQGEKQRARDTQLKEYFLKLKRLVLSEEAET